MLIGYVQVFITLAKPTNSLPQTSCSGRHRVGWPIVEQKHLSIRILLRDPYLLLTVYILS